jgi:enoyl-CoA hydratase/carnithine racemase
VLFRSESLHVHCRDRIATVWLDCPRLHLPMLFDLQEVLRTLRRSKFADVLLFRSSPGDGLPTRPTVDDYETLQRSNDRREFSRIGQETFQQLVALSNDIPTVAWIDGVCLDAGLELALACDFRVAVTRAETRFGMTWFEAGLLPCWGLSNLLPRCLGLQKAVQFVTRQECVSARRAHQLGLVDHTFSPRSANTELWWFLAEILDQAPRSRSKRLLVSNLSPHRWINCRWLRRQQPATHHELRQQVIGAMYHGWQNGRVAGLLAERSAFVDFGVHPRWAGCRRLCQQSEANAHRWKNVQLPQRVGFTKLDTLIEPWVALAITHELELALPSVSTHSLREFLVRHIDSKTWHWFDADRWFRHIRRNELALHECDFIFVTGSPQEQMYHLRKLDQELPTTTILVATRFSENLLYRGFDWTCPQRIVSLDFQASPIFDRAVRIRCSPETPTKVVLQLAALLDRAGYWPLLGSASENVNQTPGTTPIAAA